MNRLQVLLRITAALCLVASVPLEVMMIPWLPATVTEFVELQHDPAPWGTPSYHDSREQQRRQVERSLSLYFLGWLALCGLGAVVIGILPSWAELASWSVAALAGCAIGQFFRSRMLPGADFQPVFLMVYIPLGIAAVGAMAVCLILGRRPWRVR